MRYEDASHTSAFQGSQPIANDDLDSLPAGSRTPATGNLISGEGTQSGSAGADVAAGAHVTAIAGKSGEDTSFAGGKLSVTGEHGKLSVDAEGNYIYQANSGVENVRDRFTYTLADNNGATDTASLIVEIGKTPVVIKADAQQIVPGPDGVVTLPPGVELSDIRVVGRNLVIDMPDGTQLIIIDGAIFVPQLVLGGVEIPSTNLAALLIGQEPQPAAGETPPSSGGNFAVPPPPLDPGVPLGDLIPPTEYTYTPPEPQEVFEEEDSEPEVGPNPDVLRDDDALQGGNAGGVGDDPDAVNVTGQLSGSGGDGDLTFAIQLTGAPAGFTYVSGGDGIVLIQQGGVTVLTVTVESDGSYSVVQNAPIDHTGENEDNVLFTINYTVTDDDGDSAAGTFTINVDDDTPLLTELVAQGGVTLDESDAGSPAGFPISGNSALPVIDFTALFGADGAAAVDSTVVALTITNTNSGLKTAVGDFPITLVQIDGDTIEGHYNGSNVAFIIQLEADGTVTLTQNVPLEHLVDGPPGPAHDDSLDLGGLIALSVTITDGDGDQATGQVGIGNLLVFKDDGPSLGEGEVVAAVDEDELPDGISDGDGEDTTATGTLSGIAADFGADGPGSFGWDASALGGLPNLTSGGAAVSYAIVGNMLVAYTGADASNVANHVFTVELDANGDFEVTLLAQVDHLPNVPANNDDQTMTIDLSGLVKITDSDGDFDHLNEGQFVVEIEDDIPEALVEVNPVTGLVDEDDLPAGNHDDADGDDDPGDADNDSDGTTTGGDAGSLLGLFDFGADQPGTVVLSDDTSGLPALTSNNVAVTYAVNGNVLTASAGGSTVFTLTVNPDGSWVFDLEGQLDHEIAGTEDNILLDFSSIIVGVDADGDTATVPPRSFIVDVDDDMPQEFEECPDDVITINDPDAEPFIGNLNLPPVGADEPGVVTFGVEDGDPVLDNSDNPVTSNGEELFYFINGSVLEARAGDENGEVIFTITLNGDGTFTFDQLGIIGEGGEFTFNDLTSTSAGNVEFRGVGADDPATTVDLLLSADDNGTDATVNTDSDSIGSANQSMDSGETVRIDFVSNLTTGAATPSQFGYGDHVSSSTFLGVIPQVQGNQDETVAFTVWALDTSNTQATEPDRDPSDGFSDSTITQITDVTVKDYLSGNSTTVDVTGFAVGVFTPVAYGISVRVNADGSVTFSGIQQGDSYGFNTEGGEFNAVAVQADPAGTGGSTEDSFDLGVFSIGSTTEFEPVDITVPIVLTDADGDPVVCDIDIHVGPPLDVDDITVTVNEAGLDLVGSDPLSGSETQGGDLQGQVSGGTGPYTFALAPGESADGTYGTLTLNPDGTFSYTLDTPFDTQPDADDGTNPELGKDSFEVVATDSLGATQTLTIFVNIIDDVPSIDVTAADDSEVELLTQDAQTIGGLSDTDSSSADFSGVFGFTAVEGADGASVTPDLDYELGISAPGADSGLEQGGDPIYLYLIGGKVVGSTSAVEGDVDAGNTVFDVVVSATGVVTLTQYSQIDHPLEGGLNDAPFEDQVIALADELVTLTASASIVDNDGDTDQDSETVNIGANLQFADHGPVATNDVDSVVGGFDPATGNVLTGTEVAVGEDTNGTDGVPDNVGADTPGRITSIDHDASPAEAVPDGGSVSIQGDYGVLTIYSNGDYSYQRDPGTPGGVEDVFTYTLTDFDGDTDTATLTIGIDDNFPTLPDPDQILLDDDVIPAAGGNNDGPGDDNPDAPDDNVVAGQLNGTGGDAPLTYNFTGTNTLPTGFSIGAGSDANTLIIVQDQGGSDVTVMTIELNQSDGSFTVTQNNPILHDPTNPGAGAGQEDNFENNLTLSIGVEVEDADGDTDPAAITINVDDDTPTINVTKGDDSAVILTTDDAQTIGVNSDFAQSTANFSGIFGLTQSAGADGTNAAATLLYTLDVTGYAGGPGGVNSGLESHNADIFLYEIGGKVVGSTSATLAGVDGTNMVFDVTVGGDGTVTLTQYQQIDHDTADPTPTGTPFADHIVSLADGLVTLTASATLTDNDGDTITDSEVANIGANLRFTDDGPDADVSGQGAGTVTLDETEQGTDTVGGTPPVGDTSATIDFSVSFVTGGSVDYGADGPGSVTYALQLTGTNVLSGLYALDNTDLSAGDGDGYGQGGQIVLNLSGNTITGSYDGTDYFTITIDPATGIVTFTQLNNIWHPTAGSSAAALDESATLNTLAANLIQVVQTVTDFDGDTDTASINIGQGVFIIQDDGPRFGPDIDGTLNILNDANPSNTGDLDIVIGTDSPNGGSGDQTQDDISVSNFAVQVNGVDADNVILTQLAENATTASYSFTFDYDTGTGGTATAEGTLVFDKSAGTYTVTLTDGPIEGFSLLSTGAADASDFVSYQVPDGGSGSPEVTVAQLDTDFFVQFSGVAEPGAGTGSDNLTTTQGAGGTFNPTTGSFANLELFTQAIATIQVSSAAAGVGGNTIQGGEVLDLNLYATDPMGTLGGIPTQSSTSMFMTLDGIGTSEDMIVVLKLYDTSTGQYTTKAIIVQNADILTDADAASLVGTPYEGLGAALDNNDGLIVIEANDYQDGNTNLVIVGAQIAGSDEGIIGTGINLNGDVGVSGGSSGTQTFDTDVSDAPFKITSIGFLTTSTEDQTASIDFDVTIHDADGDTATQHITVNIGDTQSPALLPPDPQAFSAISTESLLASDSQEQQVQKTAANSNTLTLAAAVAAAGMAESAAAAGNSDFGRSHNNGETEFAHGNVGRVAASDSGDDAGQPAISGLAMDAANDSAPADSSSSSSAPAESDHVLDDSSASAASQSSDVPAAANDQAPAPAEASPVAMAVGMPSAEALQAAGVADDAKQDGSVEQVVADALGQGNAPAAVDALLDALPGGNGALAALAHVASPAAGDVSAWDMAASGAFGHAADMVMNVHAMQHHDAVQPVVNG